MALPNEPITRQEMYLSNIAGQNTALPDAPITREEMYLDYIAKNGGTGEGDMKKSIYDSDNSVATAGGIKMFVNQKIGTLPQRVGSLETTAGVLEGEVASIEDTLDNLGTASKKNAISVVTDSSDLVESGAVKNAIGIDFKNIFNKNAVENGIINESGAISIVGNWKSSEFIKITPSKIYIISGINGSYSSTAGFAFYDNTKTFVSGGGIINFKNTPITIPNNVEYIRFSLITSDIDTAQMELGSTATAYEPYHASVDESKCDNSVIGTVEGENASKAWSVGEHFIKDGAFKEVTQPIASGGAINDSNTVDKPIADILDTVEDITSEFIFSDDITVNTAWTHIIKKGNVVKGTLRFTTPSTMTTDRIIATLPNKYIPKEAFATGNINKFALLGAVHKLWSGEVNCLLTCSGTANCLTLAADVYTPNIEVMVTFTYLV